MKKLSLFIAFLFSLQIASAQFGFSAGYKPINAKNWEKVIETNQANFPVGYNPVPLAHGIYVGIDYWSVPYTHLRAHETVLDLVCRLLLEKKKKQKQTQQTHTTLFFFLLLSYTHT